jgi:histidine ammonia-lyase
MLNLIPSEQAHQPIRPGAGDLTLEQVVGVARYGWTVTEIGPSDGDSPDTGSAGQPAYQRLLQSREWVDSVVAKNQAQGVPGNSHPPLSFYGINTGYGSKSGRKGLRSEDIAWVSRNLIVSHSTGVGSVLHPEIVRAAILIRAHSLAQGYSGVRPLLINTLARMLNAGVVPVIPEYGSVGASGDLAPLSHLAMVVSQRPAGSPPLTGLPADYEESGKAFLRLLPYETPEQFDRAARLVTFDGQRYALLNGRQAMQARGISPIELQAKEGLALNNGTTFSAAVAALAVYDAEVIARHAEIAAALSLEALLGFRDAFFPQIQQIRRHAGQIETAERILKIVHGSRLLDGDQDQDPRYCPPQDPYSIRVTPQVIGAVWDVLVFLRKIVTEEINAATDNPTILVNLPRSYKTVSGGNFHGAPLAYAMDFLSIVLTDLGSLSERRTFRLMDPHLNNGLPAMLVQDEPGKEGRTSGLMMAQYLAAGLVSDCKTLAHPDSVDSIPTSANQEDHVSMSFNAARHARQVVENIAYVVAIEMLSAYFGLRWRLEDIRKKVNDPGYLPGASLSAATCEGEWNRDDLLVLDLRQKGQPPVPGAGTLAAMDALHRALFEGPDALPSFGEGPTSEDRFLQPYVLRSYHLLKSSEVVRRVYTASEIK